MSYVQSLSLAGKLEFDQLGSAKDAIGGGGVGINRPWDGEGIRVDGGWSSGARGVEYQGWYWWFG